MDEGELCRIVLPKQQKVTVSRHDVVLFDCTIVYPSEIRSTKVQKLLNRIRYNREGVQMLDQLN